MFVGEVVLLARVVPQIVKFLFPVLRRRDELEERISIAIEDRKAVRQEVRLVTREPPARRLHRDVARLGDRQAEAIENRRRDVELHTEGQVGISRGRRIVEQQRDEDRWDKRPG